MKTLDQTIATIKDLNAGIFAKLNDTFNCTIELNSESDEEKQKWAEVECDHEDYQIIDSANLSEDEESEVMMVLKYLHEKFRQDEDFYKMIKATERSLMYV